MNLLPITILADQTFQGVKYFQPENFDLSPNYAFATVERGTAKWNGERFAKVIADDIKADIKKDRRLMRCEDFSALHDVCDANCLGGLCDSDDRCKWTESGIEHVRECGCHPVWRIDPSNEERSGGRLVGAIDVIAEAQEIVNRWILNGHKDV